MKSQGTAPIYKINAHMNKINMHVLKSCSIWKKQKGAVYITNANLPRAITKTINLRVL